MNVHVCVYVCMCTCVSAHVLARECQHVRAGSYSHIFFYILAYSLTRLLS